MYQTSAFKHQTSGHRPRDDRLSFHDSHKKQQLQPQIEVAIAVIYIIITFSSKSTSKQLNKLIS